VDPDFEMLSHVNAGDVDLPVYFIVDGFSGRSGNFVLVWEINLIGISPSPPPLLSSNENA
jgi:hypothetical protein